MALKRKITKAEFDGLNATLQAEYKAEGAEYVLDASGFDDPAELRRALDREREEGKTAKAKATELETKLATITDTDARRAGDIATLERSWQAKVEAAKTEGTVEVAKLTKHLQATLVDSVAQQLASKLSGENASLLLPHITPRLAAELSGEKPLTRVLDKDGKPSALSVEDLEKEIAGDKRFASVIVKSRASGGGAAGGGKSGNGGAAPDGTKKFKELNDQERTEWFKRDPDGFKQAAEESRRVY